jgi:hypothetical protein
VSAPMKYAPGLSDQQWQLRAAEVRSLAKQVSCPEAKRVALEVAWRCERLAKLVVLVQAVRAAASTASTAAAASRACRGSTTLEALIDIAGSGK